MQTTYQLNTDELDSRFLESIKAAFPRRRVTIAVNDEADETESLLADPERKARLLQAIEDINAGRNLVVPDQKLFA
ncbi:MAG: hypothetical protein HY301_13465 [Verrucomicrobia bacterium]|nr:hypothetical protein [Verrucomicrobiota bacterium]